jgi:hypothetical protein
MSKERLIELAKQAGWKYADDDRGFEPLWAFAELVRADERENFCAALRQMHDAYSLASGPAGLKVRGNI